MILRQTNCLSTTSQKLRFSYSLVYNKLMPTTKAHKTRHHSNLRPKHKHTKKYLQHYWPYLPLLTILVMIMAVLQPWRTPLFGGEVLPYATEMSISSLLKSTNQQRSKNGQAELDLNSELSRAAQDKAKDMVTRDYWSHNTPEGDAPWVFVTKAGYEYQKAGENLAYGFLTGEQVVTGWMNSTTHRANVLGDSYRDVGFGFADSPNFEDSGPSTVVVAMYGNPLADAPSIAGSASPVGSPPIESFSSLTNLSSSGPQSISKIQAFTNGFMPWAQYAVGIIIGASLMYLALKHAIGLKRTIRKGERFAIAHPLLDTTLISLVVLGVLVIQRVGVIL